MSVRITFYSENTNLQNYAVYIKRCSCSPLPQLVTNATSPSNPTQVDVRLSGKIRHGSHAKRSESAVAMVGTATYQRTQSKERLAWSGAPSAVAGAEH